MYNLIKIEGRYNLGNFATTSKKLKKKKITFLRSQGTVSFKEYIRFIAQYIDSQSKK